MFMLRFGVFSFPTFLLAFVYLLFPIRFSTLRGGDDETERLIL